MHITLQQTGASDIAVVKWQLGSDSVSIRAIIERCEYGHPRIVLLDPLGGAGPDAFNYESVANVMWLTCPYLNERIHAIESDGMVSKVAEFINQDRALVTSMSGAHAHFYFFRKNLFESLFHGSIPSDRLELFDAGIGGIRDTDHIKCLHMHFAHYRICERNIAGYVTNRLLGGKINCDGEDCRHATDR
ncbi:MAG TPA: DUF501 domain-containing protein [Spirochaetota bacterium]|nr:DUF501 domain-containing protein [Spirochaetota bacterium]HNT11092.1 DUF501 domain-containing protein [Spirochaetota bacterium]